MRNAASLSSAWYRARRAGLVVDGLVELAYVVGDLVAAAAQPLAPRPEVLREVDDGAEAGEDALVGPQAGVGGVEHAGIGAGVGVPEEHRVVSERSCLEGDVGEPGVERGAVERRAVVAEVLPREQRGPAGTARRGLRVVVAEQHALAGETVEVRRPHRRLAEHGEAPAPPLVERHQQHAVGLRSDRLGHGR